MTACSSGSTTGLQKVVMMTHANLMFSIRVYLKLINSEEVLLSFERSGALSQVRFILLGTISGVKRIISTENYSPEL